MNEIKQKISDFKWPVWIPYPISIIRGVTVLSVYQNLLSSGIEELKTENVFNSVQDIDFILLVILALIFLIPTFMGIHFLIGTALKFLFKSLWLKHSWRWFNHLREGVTAFLVALLVTGTLIIFAYTYYKIFPYPGSLAFLSATIAPDLSLIKIFLGLLGVIYYHIGFIFWQWIRVEI